MLATRAMYAAVFMLLISGNAGLAHDASHSPAQALPAGEFGGPFQLIDHNGRAVTHESYWGKVAIYYFGYTSCPDICPTDAVNIAHALDLLGGQDAEVQPLFVTIDPERDTPTRLREWLGAIDSRFVGLTGGRQAVETVAAAFKVVYERIEASAGYEYMFGHPGLIYVMDRDGSFVFLLPTGTPPEVIADELRGALTGAQGN